ncbi:hypothetical protein DMX05_17170 [Pseudomonas soli]|uniref:RHS repeat-associated core domain-containing protein n=1 Tax=Pseudomonas soli TaxID=1306993 RepID=UPI000D84F12B|nr:RHS repeat-associated core domain-containing protein [Pseudomonas soli]PYC39145.1 hypothetical protein DMX05_17170 [Pseudomonas soli]
MNLKDSGVVHQPAELCTMRSAPRRNHRSTMCSLLMSDAHESVLQIPARPDASAYCAYGYHRRSDPPSASVAFNGECAEPLTGNYLLGNGNRNYSPVLMRFHSADPFSPFGQGGLNAYAYCLGDPINNIDPSGNMPLFSKKTSSSDSGKAQSYRTLMNLEGNALPMEIGWLDSAVKQGTAEVNEIKRKVDWKNIDSKDVSKHTKWVFTEDGRFFTATYELEGPNVTHPALANYARENFSARAGVVAAGALKIKGKSNYITNWSGHYRPSLSALKPVREFLAAIRIKAISMRFDD